MPALLRRCSQTKNTQSNVLIACAGHCGNSKKSGETVCGMTKAFSTAVDPTTGRHCRACPGNPSYFARDFIAKMVGRQRMRLSSRDSPSPQADGQVTPTGFEHDGFQLWPRAVS